MKIQYPVFLLIDMQERLVPAMSRAPETIARQQLLLKACPLLGVPVLVSEQYPQGLGGTVPELRELLPADTRTIAKTSFSCFDDAAFVRHLEEIGARTLVIAGCEAHVCVFQTAVDAVARGLECVCIADAVASRRDGERILALENLRSRGVWTVGAESWIFACMRSSGHPEFKAISKLVR